MKNSIVFCIILTAVSTVSGMDSADENRQSEDHDPEIIKMLERFKANQDDVEASAYVSKLKPSLKRLLALKNCKSPRNKKAIHPSVMNKELFRRLDELSDPLNENNADQKNN